MKRRWMASLASIVGLAMVCGSVAAHHGSQGFDFNVPRKTLKGTVTRFAWQNPHSQIFINVKDDSGNVVTWIMELNNPDNLVTEGWTHSSVKAKEGRPLGICVDVVFAEGRKLHASQGCSFKEKLYSGDGHSGG